MNPDESGTGADTVPAIRCIRIYTDADNITRFEDLEYTAIPTEFAPPAPPVFVAHAQAASSVVLACLPKGWTDLAHPAPARQFVFMLSGEGVATAGEEERRFGAGTIFLLEDTVGPGHGLTALTDLVGAIVRL